MEKQVSDLQAWLDKVTKYELPPYSSLPSVPLYMEQVIQYVNEALAPLSYGEKKALTSFMVNNYVKAGMIKEPQKKKYNVEHLGYLIAVTLLKEVLSMSELSLLIEMDGQVSNDKSVLYGFFCVMMRDILHDKAKTVATKLAAYQERYNKEKDDKNIDAEANLRDEIGLTAFRLAIQTQVDQLMTHALISALGEDMHAPKERQIETTPGHKEEERERKISEAETKRLALAKAMKIKEKNKEKKKEGK
jgi:hypothetical protein